jgi:hypothetical protein
LNSPEEAWPQRVEVNGRWEPAEHLSKQAQGLGPERPTLLPDLCLLLLLLLLQGRARLLKQVQRYCHQRRQQRLQPET